MTFKLVTPRCCKKMLQAPSLYLEVDENSENPQWQTLAYTSSENLMAQYDGLELKKLTHHIGLMEFRTQASFCSFCGTKAPEIVRRENFKSKICKPNDGYCDTCSKRLMCCSCYPPEWNWKPKESKIMSYAIGTIVYGLDASEGSKFLSILNQWIDENEDSEVDEINSFIEDVNDAEGFQENWCEVQYSSGGPTQAFFGVQLGEIDECNNVTIAELNKISQVTVETLETFNQKLNELPESLRNKLMLELKAPEAFILWSSS